MLTTLIDLESLTSVGGYLAISGNILENLQGLEGLTNINEYLLIRGMSSTNDLSGLNNITTIGGTFGFFVNMSLNNFQG